MKNKQSLISQKIIQIRISKSNKSRYRICFLFIHANSYRVFDEKKKQLIFEQVNTK